MGRIYQTRAEATTQAYQILLELPHSPGDEEGFIRLESYPAPEVAKRMGSSVSRARDLLRDLKGAGLFEHKRSGNTHSWHVKLPEASEGRQQQLDIAQGESHPPEVVEFERTFREFSKAYARVHGMAQQAAQFRRERDEARRELRELRATLASLANGEGAGPDD